MSAARGIRRSARLIRAGGVVAYPTESCFGLGCDPRNRRAVARVLRLKQRPRHKGLILIANDAASASHYAHISPAARSTWPGPVTWLLEPTRRARAWVRGRHSRIAIRVPDHAIARHLCKSVGDAIVSTSANPAGAVPVRSAREMWRRFGRRIDSVVPGRIGGRRNPSTIIDGATGRVLRGSGT